MFQNLGSTYKNEIIIHIYIIKENFKFSCLGDAKISILKAHVLIRCLDGSKIVYIF